ncbi:MFS transporter [Actinokineospora enzanensis]|uniref:MFS transporter n=1 Tax=Actinokineospora enzanensis TaxID=155975 RepID=UPI000475D1D8|nr:MFS transporter [Actinokineospora enzanensis]
MALKSLLIDARPLRESPEFRTLWAGMTVSYIGGQMTTFTVALQVFQLTGSSLAVGAVGLCTALSIVTFALFGGAIGDAVDRRRLVLAATSGQTLVSVVLAVQAFVGLRQLWLLYALVVVQSMLGALNVPARRTFLPRLLPKPLVPAGIAWNVSAMHLAAITGPMLAGLVIAAGGLQTCYVIDVLTFAAALNGVARLPAMRPEGSIARPGARAVGEALRLIWREPVLRGTFLVDMTVTTLGVPRALFPAINAERFGGGALTLGWLAAATAIGGLLGTLASGPVGRTARPGRAQLTFGVVWGLLIAGFGVSHDLMLSIALLALAGALDSLCVIFRSTMVQTGTPDGLRGRVGAAEYVVGSGCPQLGSFRAGALGSATSSTFSAASGGLVTVATLIMIGCSLPAFRRHRAETAE